MRKLSIVVALLVIVMPAFAAAVWAEQPWEGIWLPSGLTCDDDTATKSAIRITGSTVEAVPYLCQILTIRGTGKPSWTLAMRCTEGGGAVEDLVHGLSITRAGKLIRQEGKDREEMSRCTSISDTARATIRDRHKFDACEGSGCRVTAIEWNNIDQPIAWAVGKTTAEDAERACLVEKALRPGSQEYGACFVDTLSRPPLRIAANCNEASTSIAGRTYKLTDAARDGALPHAELSGYWDVSGDGAAPSGATITMMASWFRVLCPSSSPGWNLKPKPADK